jgi:hypothetical protein
MLLEGQLGMLMQIAPIGDQLGTVDRRECHVKGAVARGFGRQ